MRAHADNVLWTKMADYAEKAHAFHNFERAAASAGLSRLQVWAVFADKHWGAITSYVRTGRVEPEAIRDRIADLINYLHLLHGMIVEESEPVAVATSPSAKI